MWGHDRRLFGKVALSHQFGPLVTIFSCGEAGNSSRGELCSSGLCDPEVRNLTKFRDPEVLNLTKFKNEVFSFCRHCH